VSRPTLRITLRSSRRFSAGSAGRRQRNVRMLEETFEPGVTVSLVGRRHSVTPNQLFT
jgi:transposase-like protein